MITRKDQKINVPAVVMKYEGMNLYDVLGFINERYDSGKKSDKINADVLSAFKYKTLYSVLEGINEAHAKNVYHGDIHPTNILTGIKPEELEGKGTKEIEKLLIDSKISLCDPVVDDELAKSTLSHEGRNRTLRSYNVFSSFHDNKLHGMANEEVGDSRDYHNFFTLWSWLKGTELEGDKKVDAFMDRDDSLFSNFGEFTKQLDLSYSRQKNNFNKFDFTNAYTGATTILNKILLDEGLIRDATDKVTVRRSLDVWVNLTEAAFSNSNNMSWKEYLETICVGHDESYTNMLDLVKDDTSKVKQMKNSLVDFLNNCVSNIDSEIEKKSKEYKVLTKKIGNGVGVSSIYLSGGKLKNKDGESFEVPGIIPLNSRINELQEELDGVSKLKLSSLADSLIEDYNQQINEAVGERTTQLKKLQTNYSPIAAKIAELNDTQTVDEKSGLNYISNTLVGEKLKSIKTQVKVKKLIEKTEAARSKCFQAGLPKELNDKYDALELLYKKK